MDGIYIENICSLGPLFASGNLLHCMRAFAVMICFFLFCCTDKEALEHTIENHREKLRHLEIKHGRELDELRASSDTESKKLQQEYSKHKSHQQRKLAKAKSVIRDLCQERDRIMVQV